MKKARFFVGNIVRFGFVVAALSILSSSPAIAASLFWDGDGVSPQAGGAGTWNTTTAHFATSSGGTVSTTWSNTTNAADTAVFNGTAGAVTLAGPITVGVIQTTVGGYSIGNGNGIGGAANTINNPTYDTTHTTLTTTTLALNAGTVTKTGAGRLEINNSANPSTTKWVVNGGVITAPNINRFGATPATTADFWTLNNGGLGFNTTTSGIDLLAQRGITVGAGGGFFSTSATTVLVTISGKITGGSNAITFGGNPAIWSGSGHTSGGVWTLSNTANVFGSITLNGASGTQVKLGAAGVIPDAALLTMSAAGNTFDMNGFDETIKSVSGTAGTVAVGVKTLTLDNPAGETYSSVFTGATGGKIVKNGSGVLTLSGASSGWQGEFVVNNGTIGVGNVSAFGNAAGTAQLTMAGGKLANTAAAGRTMDPDLAMNISGNFTVDDSLLTSGVGTIAFGGVNTIKGGNRTITVNFTTGTTNQNLLSYTSPVGEDAAGRSLTKDGNGTMTLNAVNTYSGDTTITAGTINVDGDGTLGNQAGTLKMNGGRLNVTASRNNGTDPIANPINVTDDSAITTTSTAATVQTNLSNNSISGTSGKTLTFRNDAAAGTGAFQARFSGSGFTLASNVALATGLNDPLRTVELNSFNGTGTQQTFTGTISGTGSYTRNASTATGGGDTIFTGANSYSGGTNVSRGTLYANNTTGSATGTGVVTVGANGVLAGTGAVSGAVTVTAGGIVSPGASIESLGASGGVTFNAGTFFNYEVNGTTVDADLLNALGGAVVLDTTGLGVVLNASDLAPAAGGVADGTKFTMIAYNGNANIGQFFGIADLSIVVIGGQDYRIRYKDTNPGGNFASETTPHLAGDRFVTLTAVPELGSFITMGLVGCCAIGAVRLGKRYGFRAISL